MKTLFLINKNNICYLLRKFWPLLFLELVFAIISGITGAISASTSRAFIDEIAVNHNFYSAVNVIIFLSLFVLLKNVVQSVLKVYSGYAFSKTRIFSKMHFLKETGQLGLSFFDIPENRNIITRAEQYANVGTEQIVSYFVSGLANIIGCISIFYILTEFEWWIILFLTILMVYKLVIESILSRKNFHFKKKRVVRERRINYFSNALKTPAIITDLHIYDGFNFFEEKFRYYSDEHAQLQVKHNLKLEILYSSTYVTLFLQNIVLYFYAGFSLFEGSISVGDFTLFLTATGYLNTLLLNIKNSVTSLYPMVLEAKNYADFLAISSEFKYRFSSELYETRTISTIDTIEFQNVSFKYPNKSKFVLKNVSFLINSGETISLVGLNGSGKSTIIKLLLCLYEPTSGDILINGFSVKNLDLKSYWALCSTVFQEFSVYPIPATENVSLKGYLQSDISRIKKLFNDLQITERLEKEELGIMVPLSREFDENGTYLSGGEKQKIAFAKSSYKDNSFLILDEPSSALDAVAEQVLFDYVDRTRKEKPKGIILFVSHRLSTSTIADRILFIENGELICCGSHTYMMDHCKSYRRMYEIQSQKYKM